MPSNDQIILDRTLEDQRNALAPEREADTFFELFVAEQVLKDYDLSSEGVESGHVAGTRDGGADGIYLFVNGELVEEDTELSQLKSSVAIDLVILQAKAQAGFNETVLDKLHALSADFLNLGADYATLATAYNTEVLASMRLFKATYETLAARFPKLRVLYYYATKGETPPHPNLARKVERLEALVHQQFSAAEVEVTFLGARELLELARRSPRKAHDLRLAENPISSTGVGAFVCLVKLTDYHAFITDGAGTLQRGLFEANVRDYQGKTEVNEGIQSGLREQRPEDEFWWLNNGVTLLAAKATLSGKTLTIEDPQVVNGLQTSREIFNYFQSANTQNETRSLLVRVIVPSASESRDRIIKATNSQTAVPAASLRATEKIHHDVEEYLRPFGFYYDRRKNFYKNAGKPWDKIISIPQMAQAVMAVALQRPDTARARPSSLLKNDEDYMTVFSGNHPIELYRVCPLVMKRVEQALKTSTLEQKDRINVRFHVGMLAASLVAGAAAPKIAAVARLQPEAFTPSVLDQAIEVVKARYVALGATDQVAKGPELVGALKEGLAVLFPPPK